MSCRQNKIKKPRIQTQKKKKINKNPKRRAVKKNPKKTKNPDTVGESRSRSNMKVKVKH